MKHQHVHSYHRKQLGQSRIYKCVQPGCTHFINEQLIEGRKCICSRCGNVFIIIKATIKNCPAKPHCEDCYQTNNIDKKMDDILSELI